MSLLSYDVETYDNFQDDSRDLTKTRISVAAICTSEEDVEYFHDDGYMSKRTAKKLVKRLMNYFDKGIIPFTWNGLSFDFQILAHCSGMYKECAYLALNHYDAMFMLVAYKGHFGSLNSALAGMGLEQKTGTVLLSDGHEATIVGKDVPEMWKKGEKEAVKTYLKGDVLQSLKLGCLMETKKELRRISKKGRMQFVRSRLLTVKECLKLPVPNTSWMDAPKYRHEFYDWIPSSLLDFIC